MDKLEVSLGPSLELSSILVFVPLKCALWLGRDNRMKRIRLEVVGGDAGSNEIPLTLPATIGRGRESSVSLSHPLVSRKHCEIVESRGRVLVRDLESLNGTFVGSERVEEAVLHPGDLLTVGTVTFRAIYDDVGNHRPAPHILTVEPAVESMSRTADVSRPHGQDTFRIRNPDDNGDTITPDPDDAQAPAESDV